MLIPCGLPIHFNALDKGLKSNLNFNKNKNNNNILINTKNILE